MKRYVIERDLPGIGQASKQQVCAAAKTSNDALEELGAGIQWIESYVTGNKTFCVYLAEDEEIIRRHAELSGIPATLVTEVCRIIDPTTASSGARHPA